MWFGLRNLRILKLNSDHKLKPEDVKETEDAKDEVSTNKKGAANKELESEIKKIESYSTIKFQKIENNTDKALKKA